MKERNFIKTFVEYRTREKGIFDIPLYIGK
jgi:hypothetical protein